VHPAGGGVPCSGGLNSDSGNSILAGSRVAACLTSKTVSCPQRIACPFVLPPVCSCFVVAQAEPHSPEPTPPRAVLS